MPTELQKNIWTTCSGFILPYYALHYYYYIAIIPDPYLKGADGYRHHLLKFPIVPFEGAPQFRTTLHSKCTPRFLKIAGAH